MQKRDNWFKDYQDIPELGIKGQRKLADRLKYFDINDFKDKKVLDVGCYIGQMSLQATKWGAKYVTGVEYDKTAFETALANNKKLEANINFILDDIDNPFFWNSIKQFDTSLFLSVIDTQELENRFGILSRLSQKTDEVMYLEGHNKQPFNKYVKYILNYTTFSEIVYKGSIEDERVVIRCAKNYINADDCVDIIKKCQYNKIAVIGRHYVGKSFIRKKLQATGGKEGYKIIDDLMDEKGKWISQHHLPAIEKLVVFDYRALQYIKDIDVVFLVAPNDQDLMKKLPDQQYLRSPEGSFENIKEMYTVLSR